MRFTFTEAEEKKIGKRLDDRLENTRKMLQRFPELWALRRRWISCDGVEIRHASAIHFLEEGVCPASDMTSIRAFVVDGRSPSISNVALTDLGNQITAVGEHAIDAPDGICLRELVLGELRRLKQDSCYVFLLEENEGYNTRIGRDPMNHKWRITVVLPPKGQANFNRYVEKIFTLQRKAA